MKIQFIVFSLFFLSIVPALARRSIRRGRSSSAKSYPSESYATKSRPAESSDGNVVYSNRTTDYNTVNTTAHRDQFHSHLTSSVTKARLGLRERTRPRSNSTHHTNIHKPIVGQSEDRPHPAERPAEPKQGQGYGRQNAVTDVTEYFNKDLISGEYSTFASWSNDQELFIDLPEDISLHDLLTTVARKIDLMGHQNRINFEVVLFHDTDHFDAAVHSYPGYLPPNSISFGSLIPDKSEYTRTVLDNHPVYVSEVVASTGYESWGQISDIPTIYLFLNS